MDVVDNLCNLSLAATMTKCLAFCKGFHNLPLAVQGIHCHINAITVWVNIQNIDTIRPGTNTQGTKLSKG